MRILIADDEKNIRESLRRLLELEGMEAVAVENGEAARDTLKEERFDAVLLDLRMPGLSGQEVLEWIVTEGIPVPVVMISAHGEIPDAVRALKKGARDFLEKPLDTDLLLQKLRTLVEEEKRKQVLEAASRTEQKVYRLLGEHPSIEEIRKKIVQIGPTDSTVLITGETGTGKEIIARAIHEASSRKEEPFIAVNVGALPESLAESELFGHEKGSFTGADSRKIGLFELAGGGTLFLDEIGEMSFPLQVKLLRVLQDRKIRRVGGTRDIPVRARILSATNRNLEERVQIGEFREDLFYRLNVIRISVPPLRERRSDIPLLAEHLLEQIVRRLSSGPRKLSEQALKKLIAYDYPGNVRELENILERAVIFSVGGVIEPEHTELRDLKVFVSHSPVEDLQSVEKEKIREALVRRGGNRTQAARDLGISRRTLLYKIKRYGLREEE
jgi:two-component system response regulator AtoC